MDGIRHERVALVIVAYLIGFITAFIGFGIDITDSVDFVQVVPANNNVASVISTQPTAENSVVMTADGLVLETPTESVLLSASQYSLEEVTQEFQDGVFVGITEYDLSPNTDYVYFCEQPSREVDSCKPFVYSVATKTIYPVTIGGERIAFANEPHAVSWGSAGPNVIAGEVVDVLPQ